MPIDDIFKEIQKKRIVSSLTSGQEPTEFERIQMRSYDPAKVIFMYAALEFRQRRVKPQITREADLDSIMRSSKVSYSLEDSYGTMKQYKLYGTVADFIVKKSGSYYHFPTAKIGVPVEIRNDRLIVLDETHVYTYGYLHPFVHSSGKICYGPYFNWIKDLNIRLNSGYWLDDLSKLGTMLGVMLIRAENTLEAGYIGDSVIPVNHLDRFKPVADSRLVAEAYAMMTRIPKTRIFDNDR
jgi:hypothetical protein